MIRRIIPAVVLFQIAALAGSGVLFVCFGTLPAVLPALDVPTSAQLIFALAVALGTAFGASLIARSMAIDAFKDAIGQTPVDKNAASFIFGPGLLAVFCAPLLSLLLVSMISVAGPIASAIALGLVAGGIMSAANARAVYDIVVRMPLAPAQPVPLRKVSICIAVVCLTLFGAGALVMSAREAALHHIRASIALIKTELENSQDTYTRRLAHEREMLSREKYRARDGHASQSDIDVIKTRLGALETEAHRSITASKRELEDLTAKHLALSSIAPALGAR